VCQSKFKNILFGGSEEHCELLYNQHSHLEKCIIKKDVFKSTILVDLCQMNLSPSDIIKEFKKKI